MNVRPPGRDVTGGGNARNRVLFPGHLRSPSRPYVDLRRRRCIRIVVDVPVKAQSAARAALAKIAGVSEVGSNREAETIRGRSASPADP